MIRKITQLITKKEKEKNIYQIDFLPNIPPSGRNQVTDELPALFPRFLELGLLFFVQRKGICSINIDLYFKL